MLRTFQLTQRVINVWNDGSTLLLLGRKLCGIVEKEQRKRGREEDTACKADKEEAGEECRRRAAGGGECSYRMQLGV